jgi:hypothetical protein
MDKRAVFSSVMSLLALSGCTSTSPGEWSCQNADFEISCSDNTCIQSDGFTPMSITLSAGNMNICAYSGCWDGPPTRVDTTGRFVSFVANDLPWTQPTGEAGAASISIDIETGAATVLIADTFATPAICERISAPAADTP